jgi:thioredoxin-like negative regulator of GroEL
VRSLDELKASHERLALYLTRESCGPCHAVWPRVRTLFENDPRWKLERIDADASPELAGQLLVFSVPALILILHGQEQHRVVRIIPQAELEEAKARADALLA